MSIGTALQNWIVDSIHGKIDPEWKKQQDEEEQLNTQIRREKLAQQKQQLVDNYTYKKSVEAQGRGEEYNPATDEEYQKRFVTPPAQQKQEDSTGAKLADLAGSAAGTMLFGNPIIGSIVGGEVARHLYQGVTGEEQSAFDPMRAGVKAIGGQLMKGVNVLGANNPALGSAIGMGIGTAVGGGAVDVYRNYTQGNDNTQPQDRQQQQQTALTGNLQQQLQQKDQEILTAPSIKPELAEDGLSLKVDTRVGMTPTEPISPDSVRGRLLNGQPVGYANIPLAGVAKGAPGTLEVQTLQGKVAQANQFVSKLEADYNLAERYNQTDVMKNLGPRLDTARKEATRLEALYQKSHDNHLSAMESMIVGLARGDVKLEAAKEYQRQDVEAELRGMEGSPITNATPQAEVDKMVDARIKSFAPELQLPDVLDEKGMQKLSITYGKLMGIRQRVQLEKAQNTHTENVTRLEDNSLKWKSQIESSERKAAATREGNLAKARLQVAGKGNNEDKGNTQGRIATQALLTDTSKQMATSEASLRVLKKKLLDAQTMKADQKTVEAIQASYDEAQGKLTKLSTKHQEYAQQLLTYTKKTPVGGTPIPTQPKEKQVKFDPASFDR